MLMTSPSAPSKGSGTLRKLPMKPAQPRKVLSLAKSSTIVASLPSRSSAESVSQRSSANYHPTVNRPSGHARQHSNNDPARMLLQKSSHISEALSRAQDDDGTNWDDDFSAEELYSKLGRKSILGVLGNKTEGSIAQTAGNPLRLATTQSMKQIKAQ